MREVTRLPDRAILHCVLCEGAPFADRYWHPGFIRHREVDIEVDRRDVGADITQVPLEKYLAPDPLLPNAVWHVEAGSTSYLTFDTPSKNMDPGDVALDGGDVLWSPDEGRVEREKAIEVTITRDGSNRITSATRKART